MTKKPKPDEKAKVLRLKAENPEYTNRDIAELVDVSRSSVSLWLRQAGANKDGSKDRYHKKEEDGSGKQGKQGKSRDFVKEYPSKSTKKAKKAKKKVEMVEDDEDGDEDDDEDEEEEEDEDEEDKEDEGEVEHRWLIV